MIPPRDAHELNGRLVDDLILEEIDGELSDAGQSLLRTHLGGCTACMALRASYQRTQHRIAGLIPDRTEVLRARSESLSRIRADFAEPKRSLWGGALFALPAAAMLVISLALGVMFVRTNVASPSYPDREVVVQVEFTVPGGRATLSVEQGSRFALPGDASGVLTKVDIRFEDPQSRGLAEIRLRETGGDYGILARAPDLTGATRRSLEGRIPSIEPDATRTVEIWLHLEAPDFDSDPLLIEVSAAPGGGVRATVRAP